MEPPDLITAQALGGNPLGRQSPSDRRVNRFVWGRRFNVVVYFCNRNWMLLKSREASANSGRF